LEAERKRGEKTNKEYKVSHSSQPVPPVYVCIFETWLTNIQVSDAFNLVAEPFSGDKSKLKEFCENVEAAFGIIDPEKYNLFYKYVRTRIPGEAKAKLLVRQDADDWASVKAVLKVHYATKRTLDFDACAMFNARQAKHETVAAWCSRLDQLISDFRDVI
jgi:hypothetical protein